MRIGYLGAGAWGYCLANLLASNGHEVVLWSRDKDVLTSIKDTGEHPKFPGYKAEKSLIITEDFKKAIMQVDMVIESVTSLGIRDILRMILDTEPHFKTPLILTSKGIEQKTGLLMDEVVLEVMGESFEPYIGCLSGPSIAKEVMQRLPTSCVCSAYTPFVMELIQTAFNNNHFRVYPNTDIRGVEFGGAMKNIIAIACGIGDGLGFGANTKAALLTRGLHEMRKLSITKGCNPETLNGLAGLGDLCTTSLSPHSRNYRFGYLIAEGLTKEQAKDNIGMVVEGANTCISAYELGLKHHISVPITEVIYKILFKGLSPQEAVKSLLNREIKEEHL